MKFSILYHFQSRVQLSASKKCINIYLNDSRRCWGRYVQIF